MTISNHFEGPSLPLPLTSSLLREEMARNPDRKAINEKIESVLMKEGMLPPVDERFTKFFEHDKTVNQSMSETYLILFSNVKFTVFNPQIVNEVNMTTLLAWYQSREVKTLIQEILKPLRREAEKKTAVIKMVEYLWKEMEVVRLFYEQMQASTQAALALAELYAIDPQMLSLILHKGTYVSPADDIDDPATGELLLFNLWLQEEVNAQGVISLKDQKVLHRMSKKLEVMENLAKSADAFVSHKAQKFLQELKWNKLQHQQLDLHKRVKDSFVDLSLKIEELKKFYPIIPLVGILENAIIKYETVKNSINHLILAWPRTKPIPFHLYDRLTWVGNQRHFKILENVLESGYFERQIEVIEGLKALNLVQPAVFQRFNTAVVEVVPSRGSSSSSSSNKNKDKKNKPTTSHSNESDPVPTGSSSSGWLESPPLDSMTISPAPREKTIQERFIAILGQKPFTYHPRVSLWQRSQRDNDLNLIRNIRERGETPYKDMTEDELIRQRLLHNIPMPVEKIHLDEDWRASYTFPLGNGFGMICHLTVNGRSYNGTMEIGFTQENENRIVHRYFHMHQRLNFQGLMANTNLATEEGNEPFVQENGDTELVWGDVVCKAVGVGSAQILTMEKEGVKLSILPCN